MSPYVRTIGLSLATAVLASGLAMAADSKMDASDAAKKPAAKHHTAKHHAKHHAKSTKMAMASTKTHKSSKGASKMAKPAVHKSEKTETPAPPK